MIDKLPPCAFIEDDIEFAVTPNPDGTVTAKVYCQHLPCQGKATITNEVGFVEDIEEQPPYACLGQMLAPHCVELTQ